MVRLRREGKGEPAPFLDLADAKPRLGFLPASVGQTWESDAEVLVGVL